MAKESLSEYGSGWEWDSTYAHVFDYTQADIDIPVRYSNTRGTSTPTVNGTWVDYGYNIFSNVVTYPFCPTETTDGQILFSGSLLSNNISCESHAYNAGNYYNFPAASASTPEPATSSICPRGWMLPQYGKNTSYAELFKTAYNINYDSAHKQIAFDGALLNLPLSFIHSGRYNNNGSPEINDRGNYRLTSGTLSFNWNESLGIGVTTYANRGHSVRCVSR